MYRWQAGWPPKFLALSMLLAACGGRGGGHVDAAVVDAGTDLSRPIDVRDAMASIDLREVTPPAIDARPADGPSVVPASDAARDAATSACLRLAAQMVPAADLPLPGVPAPPMPPVIGNPGQLTPQEIAGRLSRFIWRLEPDAALLSRVEGCERLTVTDVLALAELMLRDPRAARGIQAFVAWWLELDRLATEQRDPAIFPAFTDELRRSMSEEPRLFAAHVMFNDDGTLPRLLTANYSFVDRQLAAVYDLPPVDDSFRRVDFPAGEERAGLLTMPGVLAVSGGFDRHSGPVRGKRLLERVMCLDVPPPPPMATPQIPPASERPGQSLRQAMEKSMQDPACLGCHAMLEVGFALEPFDAIGRRRLTDNGAPVDSRARLRAQPESDVIDVSGPVSLVRRLAELESTRRCFARRWLEFAIGRAAGNPNDQFVNDYLAREFSRANLDIRTLVAHVTITIPFLAPN